VIKDPLPPFVAKFCPVKFGWENALMLNAMQQFYEERFTRNFGGALASGHHQFSDLSGTVGDADRLSLMYFKDYRSVFDKTKLVAVDAQHHGVELEQIFTIGSKGAFLYGDTSVAIAHDVFMSIEHLRCNLAERFSLTNSVVATDVFSPAKYGERNASLLNSLQRMQEHMMGGWFPLRNPVFSPPTGTEFEADYLSLYFASNDNEGIVYRFCHPETRGGVYRSVFHIDERMCYWSAMRVIKTELTQLRVSLYSIPRCTAFLMGKHRRLGASMGLLSDDLCRMILALSLE
jgi:hypothetical protein